MTKRHPVSLADMIRAMREDPPSRAEFEEILSRLERQGRIRRTGEIRNGQPVYVAVKLQ